VNNNIGATIEPAYSSIFHLLGPNGIRPHQLGDDVQVVSFKWVKQSINSGRRLSEEAFRLVGDPMIMRRPSAPILRSNEKAMDIDRAVPLDSEDEGSSLSDGAMISSLGSSDVPGSSPIFSEDVPHNIPLQSTPRDRSNATLPSPLPTNPFKSNHYPLQSTQHQPHSPLRSPEATNRLQKVIEGNILSPSSLFIALTSESLTFHFAVNTVDKEPFIIAANSYAIDPMDPALYQSMNYNSFDQLLNKVKTFAIQPGGKDCDVDEEDEIDNMIYSGALLEDDNDTEDERDGLPTKQERRNAFTKRGPKKDIRVSCFAPSRLHAFDI
jgi:hypothetical protein